MDGALFIKGLTASIALAAVRGTFRLILVRIDLTRKTAR